jgi:NDP-sugar pyrophosphorylase family protein
MKRKAFKRLVGEQSVEKPDDVPLRTYLVVLGTRLERFQNPGEYSEPLKLLARAYVQAVHTEMYLRDIGLGADYAQARNLIRGVQTNIERYVDSDSSTDTHIRAAKNRVRQLLELIDHTVEVVSPNESPVLQ